MTTAVAPVLIDVPTPVGTARVHLHRPRGSRGVLLLGHGAGPSITTVDLTATTAAAVTAGWAVALVEQPWLVAGGRVAARPAILDTAWLAVAAALREQGALVRTRGLWVSAGRSAGARVACRTAVQLDAAAVLCLSFPLHPPGKPDQSRADELLGVRTAGIPVAVVQGERDPFGTPAQVLAATSLPPSCLYAVPGTHTIPRGSAAAVGAAVAEVLHGIRE